MGKIIIGVLEATSYGKLERNRISINRRKKNNAERTNHVKTKLNNRISYQREKSVYVMQWLI